MVGCALKCTNSSDKSDSKMYSFVRFPKDERMIQIWVKACGNPKCTKNSRLCTAHFDEDQFIRLTNNTKLLEFALPTLFSLKAPMSEKIMQTSAGSHVLDSTINTPMNFRRMFASNKSEMTTQKFVID